VTDGLLFNKRLGGFTDNLSGPLNCERSLSLTVKKAHGCLSWRPLFFIDTRQSFSKVVALARNPARVCNIPYILESNPRPFYSFRGLKNQMRIRIACGLDLRSRAGFWKNDRAAVHAVRTIQYNNLFYLLFITHMAR
jgi:hypothetical protein